MPYRSSIARQVAYVSSNSAPVSSVKMRAPGAIRCTRSTSTEDSFCHEAASARFSAPNRSVTSRSTSSGRFQLMA